MSSVSDVIRSVLLEQPSEGRKTVSEYARVRARLQVLLDALYLESCGEVSDLYFQMTLLVAAFDLQHEHFFSAKVGSKRRLSPI